jgi:hypothetical protein
VNQQPGDVDAERSRFRRTLVKVMSMQLASLIALWLMQAAFGP